MSVKLYDMEMKETVQRGIRWLELIPDPPQFERITENVWNGEIPLGKKRLSRKLTARFFFRGYDAIDYKVLRDEIIATLHPIKNFYVVDEDIPGKRWLVDVDAQSVKRINRVAGEWEVTFYCAKGLAESIGTTLDPFTYDAGVWAYGMGLQEDPALQDYIHSSTEFDIYNAGTEVVDPCESELLITITSTTATSTNLRLRNNTTGELWQYVGTLNAGDTITINKVESKRNGTNIDGQTNLDLISLATGINKFTVTGITGVFEISFKFRYLYL